MLTSATAPASTPATPVAADGASPETKAANAADFLALMTGGAAARKAAKTKSGPLAAAQVVKQAGAAAGTPAKTDSSTQVIAVAADAAKGSATARLTVVKTAGKPEATADSEAIKTEKTAALPAALLAALTAGAQPHGTSEITETALAATQDASGAEAGKAKAKPVRTAARREGADTPGKSETPAKPAEAAADAARAAKAEAQPATPQAATSRSADTASLLPTAVTPEAADPQAPASPLAGQLTEARIQLSTREAAQAGFTAPVLAMRVTTKDGVAKSIEIRLDPAELGQVDVKLETGHDGKLKAVLSAENASAFELLKKDGGALEAALREAGVDLADGALTFALNDSGADHSQQREAAYGGAEARRNARAEEIAAAAVETTSWRNGALDISV